MNGFQKFFKAKLFLSFFLLFVIDPVFADTLDGVPPYSWNFLIAPYGWFSALDGTVSAGDFSKDFHVPFSETLDNLDVAAELHAEASYGPWSIMLDPTYLRESETSSSSNINIDTTSQTILIDGGVFYQVASSQFQNNQSASLEILGGARYLSVDNSIEFTPSAKAVNQILFIQNATGKLVNLGSGISVSSNASLITPIVGGRIQYNFSDVLHSWLRGDVGGFGIDDVNNTWSSSVGIDYDITPSIDVAIGYRILRVDYDQNNSVSTNLLMYGPMVGVSFYI